jgi:imidazole glycerol-phosphate synthase subunit HisH
LQEAEAKSKEELGEVIAIVDYGVGNLRSVQKALEQVGAQAVVTEDRQVILTAQGVILPGVGAFGDAIDTLRATGLDRVVHEVVARQIPLFGICVGMQLLFDESEEMGLHRGLGILPGRVVRFGSDLKVPHIGWNQVHLQRDGGLLEDVQEGDFAYFVHSYYAVPRDAEIVLATTDYGVDFASVVGQGRLFGIQFHPEKSQDVGLRILRNFARATVQV